ncbi:MAG: hypothetical protein JG764_1692 [Clostridiales bacterium]|jgi:hypothetical protein|nr:hypothetical protein [Clostridiales bacterium]
MIFVSTKKCKCGFNIYLEYELKEDGDKQFIQFSDAEGNTLSACPKCGRVVYKQFKTTS